MIKSISLNNHIFSVLEKGSFFYKMKLSGAFLNQLRFNFQKHFVQNPKVKTHTMEALGHKGD